MIAAVDDSAKPYLEEMLNLFTFANRFMSKLYNCNLWIKAGARQVIINSCEGLLQSFVSCAQMAFDLDLCRFKLRPKYHMVGELLFSFKTDDLKGRETLNPLAYSTQVDEDFIGKVATFSRHVSSRTLHTRTLRRYLLALKASWE